MTEPVGGYGRNAYDYAATQDDQPAMPNACTWTARRPQFGGAADHSWLREHLRYEIG